VNEMSHDLALGDNDGAGDTSHGDRNSSAIRLSRFVEDNRSSLYKQSLVSHRAEVSSFVENGGLWLGRSEPCAAIPKRSSAYEARIGFKTAPLPGSRNRVGERMVSRSNRSIMKSVPFWILKLNTQIFIGDGS
jgi:hypothetical protein